jgi:hypothetical protein
MYTYMFLLIIFLTLGIVSMDQRWISDKQTKRRVNGQPSQAIDRTYENTKDLSRQVRERKDEVYRKKNISIKEGQRPIIRQVK